MNRLKYVLGVSVPRIASSTLLRYKNRSAELCKRHSSDMDLRLLLKTTRLFPPRTRRINDFRSFHCVVPLRSETLYVPHRKRPKADSISLKRPALEIKFPVECLQRRHNSTCQPKKASAIRRYFVPTDQTIQHSVRNRRKMRIHETRDIDMSLRKEPRTYAQLIANYSRMMYSEPGSKILKDGLNTAIVNGVHRSPFSTISVVSTKWKYRSRGRKAGCLRITSKNLLNQEAKFSSDSSAMRFERRNDCKNFTASDTEKRNKFERLSYSYAMMIERYSSALDTDTNRRDWANLIPKCDVITSLNDFPNILMDTTNRTMDIGLHERDEGAPSIKSDIPYGEKKGRIAWMSKVEDMIKDLKRITMGKDGKSSEKSSLQSVNDRAEWLDRVVSAHKKRQPPRINSEPSSSTAFNSPVTSEKHSSSERTLTASGDRPSSLADYIKRGPVSGMTTSQTPTNTSTVPGKQPQIELRMTPSQNESVVSINVDEQRAKSAGTDSKEQLSVIISSMKNNPSAETSNTNFDSMQISISENTVPVKQIEFSINGKPVSELKSIVARADKLDVLSSMDKVEIRIPQTASSNAAQQQTNAMRTGANPSQVLNLQIAAKFNDPRAQRPKDTGVKTNTVIPSMSPASAPTPGPQPIPPPTQVPPYNPRTQNLASSRTINTRSVDSPNKSDMNMPSRNNSHSTINENTDATIPEEERTPSNVNPWWSSDDSFRKIRKKTSIPKQVASINKQPRNTEERASEQRKSEEAENSNRDIRSVDSVDGQKTEGPAKGSKNFSTNPVPRKTEDLANFSKHGFRVVPLRVRQATTQHKRANEFKTNKAKKMRYRVKRPKVADKKGKPIKTRAKHVPANPQKFVVFDYPRAKRTSGELTAKSKNRERSKEDTKAKNVAEEAEETNVQHPITVFKETRGLDNPDNKSANVSAKAADKEQEKRLERGKNFTVDEEPDQRVRQIMKSMKPIEKRKDGTLIDYGVVVPSRKPSNIRHVPSPRMKKIDEKDTSIQEKIVEPRKDSSKDETPKESASVQTLVESEKTFIAKKEVESANPEAKDKKELHLIEEKNTKDEKSSISVNALGKRVISEDSQVTEFSDANQPLKVKETDTKEVLLPDKSGKNLSKIDNTKSVSPEDGSKLKSSENAGSVQPSKIPVKSNNNTNIDDHAKASFNKSTQGHVLPEEQSSKTASIARSEDNVKFDEKVPVESTKDNIKTSEINVTDSSKPKMSEKVNTITMAPGKQVSKTLKSETVEEKKEDAKFPAQPIKDSTISTDKNIATFSKSKVGKSENVVIDSAKQASKSTVKSEAKEEKKSDANVSTQPREVSIKPNDSVANFSSSKTAKKAKSSPRFTEKAETNILTPGAREKVDRPHSAGKKVTRTDSHPITGAIVPPSQKSSDKGAKNDSKSSEESKVQSKKKLINVETAPLEGTINYQPGKNLDNPTSSGDTAGKKTLSEVIEERRKDLSVKTDDTKPTPSKGGGSSGGPATPTGPAGLLSTRSFTVSQVCAGMQIYSETKTTIEEKSNEFDIRATSREVSYRSNREKSDEMKLFLNKSGRPEKNMLYSSWLQRFKD